MREFAHPEIGPGGWQQGASMGARIDVHIDRSQGTVCYRAADGTGKGESGVESDTAQLAGSVGSGLLDNGVDLGRAGGGD